MLKKGLALLLMLALIFVSPVAVFAEAPEKPAGNEDFFAEGFSFSSGARASTELDTVKEAGKAVYTSTAQDIYPIASPLLVGTNFYSDGNKVKFQSLGFCFSATFEITEENADYSWSGVGLAVGNVGSEYYYTRLQRDGAINLIAYDVKSNSERLIATSAVKDFKAVTGASLGFTMFRTPSSLTMYVNGTEVFSGIAIPQTGNKFGVYFAHVGAGSYVHGFKGYFTDDVTVEKTVEPTWSSSKKEYPENTEVIQPDVKRYNGALNAVYISLIAVGVGAIIAVSTVLAVKHYRKKRTEK